MSYLERSRARVHALCEAGHATLLAIETSCDETAAAVVRDGRVVVSNIVATQIDLHAVYGGVVPEIASRKHVETVNLVVAQALEAANMDASGIDALAVTQGPGLVGALLSGVSCAKALAYAWDLPLIPVNHIEGHVSANYIAHPELQPPFVCLVVSGGHTHIVSVEDYGVYRLLGQTQDDAAGEAFDKAARVLSLPYPGGPLLDQLAEGGDPTALKLPRARTEGAFDFSFSGVKTSLHQQMQKLTRAGQTVADADVAASFRAAVVETLVDKTVAAARHAHAQALAMAGGVAANTLLRKKMAEAAQRSGLRFYMPPLALCTDNAAMIGSAGFYRLLRGEFADLSLNAVPNLRWISYES